ncbi:MAG TPA: hypothetical protein VFV98_20675 [Vicinamibacterales bacterium]|nr:hypothetical protein [Vicinamibacterales bacterium]
MLAVLLVIGPAATLAYAVSIADLVNLRANGVSDEILIALIQNDGTVFKLSADDVLELKKRGLSDRVVLAMLLNGRRGQTNAPAPAPIPAPPPAAEEPRAPSLGQVTPTDEAQRSQRIDVDRQPAVINVSQNVTQTVEQAQPSSEPQSVPVACNPYGSVFPFASNCSASPAYPAYAAYPVYPAYFSNGPARDAREREAPRQYWGFNGERRPDSWAPSGNDRPAAPPPEARRVPGSISSIKR